MLKRSVTVLAPAKLNLSLDVVGTLPNGYHDLDMVMQTIDLYEKITLCRSNTLSLTLPGSFVPVNDKNTAIKAAVAFFRYTGLLAGVDMTIYKRVPVRAGMAGGSADAAGVLVGLSELYDAHLSMSELCAIGAGIGADVPFALLGGTCRVRGVGDLMKALPPCPDCWFVVAMPSVGVSTPEAFARYDTMGSPVHPDCEAQEQAIRAEDLRAVCAAAGNALEHCSGAVETPSICATLREHGALTAQMTGSGAAVFGVFDDETAARNALAALPDSVLQAGTTTGAEAALRQALPVLHQAAQQALYKAHSPQTARLKLERLDFAPRDYGSFALPGGRYTALRVELGEGKGHNWFCVLYPALCVSGAQAKYPSQAENALVFGRYEVRFAVVDAVKNWIQQ